MTHSPRLRLARPALAFACALIAGAASATTITFSGFGGVNNDNDDTSPLPQSGDPFTSYTESGYTVTPTGGTLLVAKATGNDIPAIYADSNGSSAFGRFDVTFAGGAFTFSSLDLAAIAINTPVSVSYTFTGLLGGVTKFSTAPASVAGTPFMIGSPVVFTTVLNSFANLAVDRLTVAMTGGATSFTIDNINVTAVPEPASAALFALGLAAIGVAGVRRTRGAA